MRRCCAITASSSACASRASISAGIRRACRARREFRAAVNRLGEAARVRDADPAVLRAVPRCRCAAEGRSPVSGGGRGQRSGRRPAEPMTATRPARRCGIGRRRGVGGTAGPGHRHRPRWADPLWSIRQRSNFSASAPPPCAPAGSPIWWRRTARSCPWSTRSGVSAIRFANTTWCWKASALAVVWSRFRAALIGDATELLVLTLHERSMADKLDRQLTHRGAARSITAMAAMLAHEVKNPLSGIRGAAQLLEQDADRGRHGS